jgi:hypothetical protein
MAQIEAALSIEAMPLNQRPPWIPYPEMQKAWNGFWRF